MIWILIVSFIVAAAAGQVVMVFLNVENMIHW